MAKRHGESTGVNAEQAKVAGSQWLDPPTGDCVADMAMGQLYIKRCLANCTGHFRQEVAESATYKFQIWWLDHTWGRGAMWSMRAAAVTCVARARSDYVRFYLHGQEQLSEQDQLSIALNLSWTKSQDAFDALQVHETLRRRFIGRLNPEKLAWVKTFDACEGNVAKAARELGHGGDDRLRRFIKRLDSEVLIATQTHLGLRTTS